MPWFRRLLLDHLNAFAPPGILRIPSSTFHTSKHSPHPSQAVGTRYKVTKLIKTQTQMIIHFPITHYMKAYKTCIRLFNCQLIRVIFRNVLSFLININEEKKRNGKQKESIICACNIKQDAFVHAILSKTLLLLNYANKFYFSKRYPIINSKLHCCLDPNLQSPPLQSSSTPSSLNITKNQEPESKYPNR